MQGTFTEIKKKPRERRRVCPQTALSRGVEAKLRSDREDRRVCNSANIFSSFSPVSTRALLFHTDPYHSTKTPSSVNENSPLFRKASSAGQHARKVLGSAVSSATSAENRRDGKKQRRIREGSGKDSARTRRVVGQRERQRRQEKRRRAAREEKTQATAFAAAVSARENSPRG